MQSPNAKTVMARNWISAMLCLTVTWVASGCGGGSDKPELGQVSGKVTMDGKPLPKVVVTFNPEDGRPSLGETDDQGQFTMMYLGEPGAKVGKHVVSISTPPPENAEDGGCEEPGEEGQFLDPIPLRYNAEAVDNPEMNVEVKPGDNTFEFKLTSDGPKATGGGCGGYSEETCCE